MRRVRLPARPDWMEKAEAVGFTYHTEGLPPELRNPNGSWWFEDAAWEFTADEIDVLEEAAEELHRLCLSAVSRVVHDEELMARFAIPEPFRPWIRRSWERDDPYLIGRMDLAFAPGAPGLDAPKLIEYNADTPTTTIETAVIQWRWLQDVKPGMDQFNSLHEKIIERFEWIGGFMPRGEVMHFSGMLEEEEEARHIMYYMDLAEQAGIKTRNTSISAIGWDAARKRFVDLNEEPIRRWFKLYPWEWLMAEEFGVHLLEDTLRVIEPPWKAILSNKNLLPLLWDTFPDHPNLLPAFWTQDARLGQSYVKKPVFAREGANVRIVRDGRVLEETAGLYGDGAYIWQALADIPEFDGVRPILGAWLVGDKAAGMIVRETDRRIVKGGDRVAPHWFAPRPEDQDGVA